MPRALADLSFEVHTWNLLAEFADPGLFTCATPIACDSSVPPYPALRIIRAFAGLANKSRFAQAPACFEIALPIPTARGIFGAHDLLTSVASKPSFAIADTIESVACPVRSCSVPKMIGAVQRAKFVLTSPPVVVFVAHATTFLASALPIAVIKAFGLHVFAWLDTAVLPAPPCRTHARSFVAARCMAATVRRAVIRWLVTGFPSPSIGAAANRSCSTIHIRDLTQAVV